VQETSCSIGKEHSGFIAKQALQEVTQVAHIAAASAIEMVVPERRQEASDEEDEFVSGEEQSGDDEDDKSEFSVSEDEDGEMPQLHALCCQAPAVRQLRIVNCSPGSVHLGLVDVNATDLATLHNADENARRPDTADVTAAVDDADAAKATDQPAAGAAGDASVCVVSSTADGGWNDRGTRCRAVHASAI
jgi:hypothetical protein